MKKYTHLIMVTSAIDTLSKSCRVFDEDAFYACTMTPFELYLLLAKMSPQL
jgi:hypothetical protein